VYPWKSKEKSKTIAAGFCYQSGVLLCADTLHEGWTYKIHETKIRNFAYDGGRVAFTFAGQTDLAITAIQKCQQSLESTKPLSGDVIVDIEKILDRAYRKSVLSHPDHASLHYYLLIAVQPLGGDAVLYRTNRTSIRKLDSYGCIGIGDALTHALIRHLFTIARYRLGHGPGIGETSTETLMTCSPPPRAMPFTGVTSE
jgi:hypothetical protein